MKIGIIGLGIMGKGMAHNFLKHNQEVYIWNRTESVSDEFIKYGAVKCGTPAEVTEKSELIFEVTANDESSKAMWYGKEGILSKATKDKILITSATLSINYTDELINKCKELNLNFLDIPLTGGRIGAETGNLTLLCGGSEEILEKIKPTLSHIAGTIFHFGPEGHGMRYKLILNFIQAVHMVSFGQSMKIAKAGGMNIEKVAEALAVRPGGVITNIAKEAYFKNEIPKTFTVEWITKDVTYAKEFVKNLDIPFLDEVVKEYTKVLKDGYKDEDWAFINSYFYK